MDFIDALRNFSSRALKIKDSITSEDATKTALVMPFFQLLGYDVFNPLEFVPEFTADVGVKKGEKVDYAIVIDDSPVILVECKKYGEMLDKHSSQLFRYFGTTTAKFAILTDGITYKFYTDLSEANKMDLESFLTINILDIPEHITPELKRFTKADLNIETAYLAAVDLKYTNKIKKFLATQRAEPTENFIKYMISEVFDGRATAKVVEMFAPIVKHAFNQYINDNIRNTLKNAMQSQSETKATSNVEESQPSEAQPHQEQNVQQALTSDELEAFKIVKAILRELCDVDRLFTRSSTKYISVLLDDNRNKRVCRFWFKGRQLYITIPDENRQPMRYDISSLNDIFGHAQLLKEACNRHLTRGEFEEEDEEEAKE